MILRRIGLWLTSILVVLVGIALGVIAGVVLAVFFWAGALYAIAGLLLTRTKQQPTVGLHFIAGCSPRQTVNRLVRDPRFFARSSRQPALRPSDRWE